MGNIAERWKRLRETVRIYEIPIPKARSQMYPRYEVLDEDGDIIQTVYDDDLVNGRVVIKNHLSPGKFYRIRTISKFLEGEWSQTATIRRK